MFPALNHVSHDPLRLARKSQPSGREPQIRQHAYGHRFFLVFADSVTPTTVISWSSIMPESGHGTSQSRMTTFQCYIPLTTDVYYSNKQMYYHTSKYHLPHTIVSFVIVLCIVLIDDNYCCDQITIRHVNQQQINHSTNALYIYIYYFQYNGWLKCLQLLIITRSNTHHRPCA